MATIEIADIVGPGEIAERAKVGPSAVSNWITRHDDFPKPITVLKCGALYSWTEVETWLRTPRVSTVTRVLKPKLP